jgi:hypothetical protein
MVAGWRIKIVPLYFEGPGAEYHWAGGAEMKRAKKGMGVEWQVENIDIDEKSGLQRTVHWFVEIEIGRNECEITIHWIQSESRKI